jgi:TonB-linked SusC/RagA family outer membrane protein
MEKRLMTLLACFFLLVGGAFAQTKVSGTVLSQDDGQPVIGASVLVVGTTVGTVTNAQGQFSLNVPAGKKTLRITYVGMEPLEVSARPNMRIFLTNDQKALDEVIVVAYGTQKKSSFTGSAAVLNSEEIGKVQVTNAVDALRGKAAGVQITSLSGAPGSTPTIRIRGVNSINADSAPLIVLDGSPYEGSLNDINPTDVESMTVLKDAASTALYGARGGNGVILITTKTAKKGSDAQITFDAKWGNNHRATPQYEVIDHPAGYYEAWYKSLNNYAVDKLGYDANQAWIYANNAMFAPGQETSLEYNVYNVPNGQYLIGLNGKLNPNATLGNVVNGYTLLPDDWEDAIYSNGLRQEYTVSATGSNDKGSFYASVNYLDNEGITTNSNYRRLTTRLNADYQLKSWLKVGGNMSYAHFNRNYLGNDGESGSSGNIFALGYIAPIYPVYIRDAYGNIVYDENSKMYRYDYGDVASMGLVRPYLSQSNPISSNQLDKNNSEGNVFNGTGTVEVRFPLGITFTSINNVYLREWRYTGTTNPFFGQYANLNGQVVKEHQRYWSFNYQQRLNWKHLFGKHDIDLMAGHEYYRLRDYDLNYYKNNQFSPENDELAGAVVAGSGTSSRGDYNTESWLARAMYNYDERYFLQGSFTYQASSHFDPEHRWGCFWSVGGGWLINKEKFMEKLDWIDELKLKISYGENGNDQIGAYRYVNYYDIVNSNDNAALVPSSLGNPEITWEKNAKFNVGLDFSLWRGRLTGGIEYYSNYTRDMLTWFSLPYSFGYTGYYDNVGNMRNNGVEIQLNGEIIRKKDFNWSIYANFTSNHNEITSLPDDKKISWTRDGLYNGYQSGNFFYTEGESRYSYYTKKYAGVDPDTGESLWCKNVYKTDAAGKVVKDINGNPVVDHVGTTKQYGEADDYIVGDVLPDVYGGFGTSISWKGIDLSVDFQYQLGGQVYDSQYSSLMAMTRGYGIHVDMLDAWSPTNPTSNIPRMQFNDTRMNAASDRFLTSASYLSLQNITIGYTLPRTLTSRIGIQKVRLYGVADNIWIWSKRQGLDPRVSITGNSGNGYYSPIRTISGGITVSF